MEIHTVHAIPGAIARQKADPQAAIGAAGGFSGVPAAFALPLVAA